MLECQSHQLTGGNSLERHPISDCGACEQLDSSWQVESLGMRELAEFDCSVTTSNGVSFTFRPTIGPRSTPRMSGGHRQIGPMTRQCPVAARLQA